MKPPNITRCRFPRRGVTVALVLLLTPFFAGIAFAQEKAEFEFTAVCGVGLGERSRPIDHPAWGGSLYGGWRLAGTPLSLGGRLALVNYGSEHNADLAGYSAGVPADVKYSHNLLTAHVVVRYQPQPSRLTPYLEASAGLGHFFTQVYRGNDSGTPIILGDTILFVGGDGSETLMSSLAPSLGLGGGLKIRVAQIRRGDQAGRSPLTVSMNVQGRYVYNGTAQFLEPGGLALDGGRIIARPRQSPTNTFGLGLGLSLGWESSTGTGTPPSGHTPRQE